VIRRCALWLGAAAALTIAACIDMSPPKSGVGSISQLLLPSPSVVVGDVMRDSLGAPAPLSIIAYDARFQPIPGLPAQFFVLDTGAHVNEAGLLFGDRVSSVRVIGSIAGLQTLGTTVPVTVPPDSLKRVGTADSLVAIPGGDSTQNMSTPLSVTVTGVGGTGVNMFVVRYRILYAPAAGPGQPPTAYIGNDAARPSNADTTDAAGGASRRAVLRIRSLGVNLPDSIVVEASASYKGALIKGAPSRFVVRVKP
jgi:hypothetical protein